MKKSDVVLARAELNYSETMRQVLGYLRGLVGNPQVSIQFFGQHTDVVSKFKVRPLTQMITQPDNVTSRLTHIINDVEHKEELKLTITPSEKSTLVTLVRQVRRKS